MVWAFYNVMNGVTARKDEPFSLIGADGAVHSPMYPRDVCLPSSESVNCHCTHRGIINYDILGLPLEERERLQGEAIAADNTKFADGEFKFEQEKSLTNPENRGIIDIGGELNMDISIDTFFPCLEDAKTGEIVETFFSKADNAELKGLQNSV